LVDNGINCAGGECAGEELRMRAEADTSLSSTEPGRNFGQHEELRIGDTWKFWIRFPAEGYVGSEVDSATLRLKVFRSVDHRWSVRVCQIASVERFGCQWQENGPTWGWTAIRRNCTSRSYSGVNPGDVVRVDVTDAVREWASEEPNCGFEVTMEDPLDGAVVRFHSDEGGDDDIERPRLEVECP